jgi:tRNA(His) 5'-end guanylyltransferase
MAETMKLLCENIQNAVFGYTQSDEISILLNDWKKFNTSQWFDGKIQKIASVSASMATGFFNKKMALLTDKMAFFDARVFNLPKEEVVNYFHWRQVDCTRNSIQMLGRYYFSHKELHGISTNDIQNKLFEEKKVNWSQLNDWEKRGSVTLRNRFLTAGWVRSDAFLFKDHRYRIEDLLIPEEE